MQMAVSKEALATMKRITIDPITRLEGHGKIEIFLDDEGDVDNAYFQIPELRGFEQFCVGRPGGGDAAHHQPHLRRLPGSAPYGGDEGAGHAVSTWNRRRPLRKCARCSTWPSTCTDHTVHFYALGGPDFVVGPDAPPAERNILGVIHKVGVDIGKQVIDCRKRNHHVIKMLGGRGVHPVAGMPGGWSQHRSPKRCGRKLKALRKKM